MYKAVQKCNGKALICIQWQLLQYIVRINMKELQRVMFISLASSVHSLIHILFQLGNKLVPPTCKCEKTSNHNQIKKIAGGLKHLGLKQVRARFVDISCFSGNGIKKEKTVF
jgi:hypothetical protein